MTDVTTKAKAGPVVAHAGSQIDIADRFAAEAQPWLRYVCTEKQWHRWDGVVWRKDETLRVRDALKKYLGSLSLSVQGSDGILRTLASSRQIGDVERICQHDGRLVTTPDQWDAEPYSICTPGGIVDLTTGEIRAAQPEDYCRTITAAAPAERGAPLGPLFQRVLDNVTSGDAAVARYLQKVAGYCAFGRQLEKALFIVVGEPDSGKSTLFKTLRLALGEYATSTNVENFLEDPRHFRTSTNNVAELCGYRLVVTGEPDPNATLSASWIKRFVGPDEVHTRLNYQQGRVGATTWKAVIHCNQVPRLGPGGDQAVRNRLRILPGGRSIPYSEQIGDLDERLRDEYPAILRWMIDGAVMVMEEGLGALPGVAETVAADYYREQDPLLDWIAERVEKDDSAFTPTDELWRDFTNFGTGGIASKEEFSKRLAGHQWRETDPRGKERIRSFTKMRRSTPDGEKRGFGLRLAPKTPVEEPKLW